MITERQYTIDALRVLDVHQQIERLRKSAVQLRARGTLHALVDAEMDDQNATARVLVLQTMGLPIPESEREDQ